MEISNFRYIVSNVVCPPSPGTPVFFTIFFHADTERKLSCITCRSRTYRFSFCLFRYRLVLVRYPTPLDVHRESVRYTRRFSQSLLVKRCQETRALSQPWRTANFPRNLPWRTSNCCCCRFSRGTLGPWHPWRFTFPLTDGHATLHFWDTNAPFRYKDAVRHMTANQHHN